MNRIQSNNYRIGTYEINKILLSCFDGRIYFQSNGYNGLALEYRNSYFDTYLNKFFLSSYKKLF